METVEASEIPKVATYEWTIAPDCVVMVSKVDESVDESH